MDHQFDIFIDGLTIDLCVATEAIAYESDWYKWFNDRTIVTNLPQGRFPNTREAQREFFISETSSGKRLLLLVVTKDSKLKGVVSLSNICFMNNTAEIALVIDSNVARKQTRLASLEALALMTQHGFDVMGLDRISGLQNRTLGFWQRHMELLGYRAEGIHRFKSMKTRKFSNFGVYVACSYDDYKKIIENRGRLFDDEAAMIERIKSLPKVSIVSELVDFLEEREQYYSEIWNL